MVFEIEQSTNLIKLNSKVFRSTQVYLDRVLKKYDLSSGTFRYLFILETNEGISQNQISYIIGNDKAMSARTIMKLIELGYVTKKEDEKDGRAYNLYLTVKAREVIPKLHKEIDNLIVLVTEELTEEEKKITEKSLEIIMKKVQVLNEYGGN